jgi:ParB family transcriptional regulator, chromosome partitioning protein
MPRTHAVADAWWPVVTARVGRAMSGQGSTPGNGVEERDLVGSPVARSQRGELRRLPLHLVQPRSDQPRQSLDPGALEELAQSIRTHGVLQPIRVRARQDRFEIVAGERRWRAAGIAGLHDIPAIIVESDDDQAYVEALIENVQREDLNAIDRAQALTRLRVSLRLRSWQEVGELVGITRQHVHNLLKVVNLPEPMREDIRAGALTERHARALLRLQGHPDEQRRLWERINSEKISGRLAEEVARSVAPRRPLSSPAVGVTPPADLSALVDEMLASLMTAGPEEVRRAREQLADLHRQLTRLLGP